MSASVADWRSKVRALAATASANIEHPTLNIQRRSPDRADTAAAARIGRSKFEVRSSMFMAAGLVLELFSGQGGRRGGRDAFVRGLLVSVTVGEQPRFAECRAEEGNAHGQFSVRKSRRHD